MSNFQIIKTALQKQYDSIKHLPLFVSNASKDELWDTYIQSLTDSGHNEIYRERGEHDCQCCKQYIRRMGNILAIVDGELVSLWDVTTDSFYDETAKAMSDLVKSKGIRGIFLSDSHKVGTDSNLELREDGTTHTWEHFYQELNPAHVETDGYNRRKIVGRHGDYYGSLKLSMEKLTVEAVETVLELIKDKALYRGDEHKSTVELMLKTLREYATVDNKELWLWTKSRTLGSLSTMRSTVIGTLVIDLSNGMELTQAVKAFESKVAPANYKRTTALVTKGMIKKAEETVVNLGLTESLSRRHARITDITVNNVIFSDRAAQQQMDGIFGQLMAETTDNVNPENSQEIPVEDFIKNIVPTIDSMDAYLDNAVANSNAMTLVAPVNPDAPNILKWDNNFTWAYNGDVTDSIKEKVKAAGGKVDGELRISLAWYNGDDLDIHMQAPNYGHVYYGNKRSLLDVDMNAMSARNSVDPVENITFPTKRSIYNGVHTIKVNNYCKRNSHNPGFVVELEYQGKVTTFTYDKPVKDGETITALTFKYTDGKLEILDSLPSTSVSKEVWGLSTQKFHRVSAMMLSPNHWDDNKAGNKHYFFMLEGFKNPESVRGFYNEFLSDELREHRKVFELLGSKMKAAYTDDQLSGLGFSSTIRNELIVRAKGSNGTRLYKVKF